MYGLTRAPDFDRAGLHWFNVDKPLTLADLRGRLLIIDFWTFCCINCMHVLPTLRRVEESFPDEVAVIGVHSPKFLAERQADNVAHAIARYDIRHPVVHDPHMTLWREYAVRAWPTLIFVAPDGMILGDLPGEPDPDLLLSGVGEIVRHWRRKRQASPAPLPLTAPPPTGGRLRFPGKIKPLAGANGSKRWAVADSGHHQIVVFDDDGVEVARWGNGRPGFIDLDATGSAFNGPQGLVCGDGAIYVADTGNHAIRRIDLDDGTVRTLSGDGQRGLALRHPLAAGDAALASVWDLALAGDRLLFANAGSHQIGELDLCACVVQPLAGCGAEAIVDGPALDAHLAQPSALAFDAGRGVLYFADSESSAVRAVHLGAEPRVETLVGAGLFDFGHQNGPFDQARLQHALGLDLWEDAIVVADSYNGCLRVLDVAGRCVSDLGETAFACPSDACRPPGEPAGVAADGPDRLLMADTNNHRILEIRPSERSVSVWAS